MSEIFIIKNTGKGIINSLAPENVIPIKSAGSSDGVVITEDSDTVAFTGNGTVGNPLSAESVGGGTESELIKLRQYIYLQPKNLIDINSSNIQVGKAVYDVTYAINSLVNYSVSDWIPVLPNTQYSVLKYGNWGKNIQFTNASKVSLGLGIKVGLSGTANVRFTFTTPSDCFGIYYTLKGSADIVISPNMMIVLGNGLQDDGVTEVPFIAFGAEPQNQTVTTNEIIGKTPCIIVADKLKTSLVGKKVAWYGTSIPAGFPNDVNRDVYSYANRAVHNLGGSILNFSLPNGCIRKKKSDGSSMSGGRDLLSFTNLASATNYQNKMLDLIGTSNEPDLYVFDYGVNDRQEDVSDMTVLPTTDSIDVNTFYGAYNFVIKQLLTAKPKAKVLILSHYSDDSYNSVNYYKPVNDVVKVIAEKWNIERLYVNEKSGIINNGIISNFTQFVPDAIHPASDSALVAVKMIQKMCEVKLTEIFKL